MAKLLRCNPILPERDRTGGVTIAPSPGTPGEGWGEGLPSASDRAPSPTPSATSPSFPTDDPASPIQLYRITQEAITNAVRHGRAKNIYIDLVEVEGRVILTVEDDGLGIDHAAPPTAAAPGLGVRTMRHRARMIGATLAIEPADGGGTIVTCKLPARPAAPATAAPDESPGVPHAE